MKKSIIILSLSFLLSFALVAFQNVQTASSTAITDETVIIIDAGHGGEDGGAVGADGTVEKDINLAISLKVNNVLSSLGYKTHMIRTDDVSVHNKDAKTVRERKVSDIHNRAAAMNEYENCIYVSIHQNKYESSSIWGAQTFYSPNDDKSKILANFIQNSIKTNVQPTNNRVIKKSGTNIYVLYEATKPAIMVECGFLSNPKELELLKSDDYQNKMAYSISYGIINYLISEVNNGTKV